MLTSIDPGYEFVDGAGFIVGDFPRCVDGDTLFVYTTAVMNGIDRNDYPIETVETISSPYQIFINNDQSMPVVPTTVTTVNYIPAKLSSSAISKQANDELIEKYQQYPAYRNPMYYTPKTATFKAGQSVTLESDIGILRDITITL